MWYCREEVKQKLSPAARTSRDWWTNKVQIKVQIELIVPNKVQIKNGENRINKWVVTKQKSNPEDFCVRVEKYCFLY